MNAKDLKIIKQSVSDRKRAYSMAFTGTHGDEVMKDLAMFCRAEESCFHPDARVHAVMEGRREVWLHIKQQLNLSEVELFARLPINRKVSND
jgi:hypothetical protein